MKKFVFLYNVDNEVENTKEQMDAWMSWFHSISKSVVDIGNPLVDGKDVKANKAIDITQEMGIVSGYSIINAPDMKTAIEIANGCPNKSGMKIYESVPM